MHRSGRVSAGGDSPAGQGTNRSYGSHGAATGIMVAQCPILSILFILSKNIRMHRSGRVPAGGDSPAGQGTNRDYGNHGVAVPNP
jgi:hypothetical protein